MLLLLLSQGGYQVFFAIRQHEIKEENKQRFLAGLPLHALDVVEADRYQADIEWEEEGREFYLHGQLYDVAYTKTIDGKKYIYCLNDAREEKLLDRLAGIAGRQSGQNQHNQNPDIPFFNAEFIAGAEVDPVLLPEIKTAYAEYDNKLISATADIPHAPPD